MSRRGRPLGLLGLHLRLRKMREGTRPLLILPLAFPSLQETGGSTAHAACAAPLDAEVEPLRPLPFDLSSFAGRL